MKFSITLLSLGIILFFNGCVGSKIHVYVDSIGNTKQDSSYLLLSGNKNVTKDDLQFKEYSSYVKKVLSKKGFTFVDNPKVAEQAIFLSYGISAPSKTNSTISMPIYGQTGVSSSYTNGTLNTYGNRTTYSGNTTYIPKYGVTGYNNIPISKINYTRYITLNAIDIKEFIKTEKYINLWKTKIISTGSTGDLRKIFPYLVIAGEKYIGTNTGEQIKVVVYETDSRVKEIKKK